MNMDEATRVADLKQVLGAMIFGANRPLSVREMRNCLCEVAQASGGHAAVFADVKDSDIRGALEELTKEFVTRRCGFMLAEVSGGYRLQSDESCGVWLKQLLNMRKANRLSQPSLETLAIIACRQPITRAEIEGIRGVSVDHVIKSLMELQLVRIVGRSELPGRPFLFGTTQVFLDHFGLKDLKSLGELTGVQLQARKPTVAESIAEPPPVGGVLEEVAEEAVAEQGELAEPSEPSEKSEMEESDKSDKSDKSDESGESEESEESEEEDDEDLDDDDEDEDEDDAEDGDGDEETETEETGAPDEPGRSA